MPRSSNPRNASATTRRPALLAALGALAFLLLAAATAPRAGAVTDAEELTRFASVGSAAGQLNFPAAAATDPVTGHLYVSDLENNRISEFTPWGKFVRAFGWDVAPGAVNEQQEVRVSAAAGAFKLSFAGSTTLDLPFDADATEVQAALNALPSIGGAGASVSVSEVAGNPNGATPYIYAIAFKGSLAGSDVAQVTASDGATPLSGGIPASGVEARTTADGTPGGTGLESCSEESGCKAGLRGGGAGELSGAQAIAVDAEGNVYVGEQSENFRVQKLDSAGRFLAMFGGEVDKATGASLCTAASGDECGVGVPGTGPGQFAAGFAAGIALGAGGTLFAADEGRVQRFSLAGEYQASVPVPGEGEAVRGLARDPVSGDLYALSGGKVRRLDPGSGAEVGQLAAGGPPLATDSAGHVFDRDYAATGSSGGRVLEFDPAGKQVSSCCEGEPLPPPNPSEGRFDVRGLAVNAAGTLYVAYFYGGSGGAGSFIRAFGPPPVRYESPPPVAPQVIAQFATSVQRDGATVAADINPRFFTDAHYRVQYGIGKCSEGGCDREAPLPAALLTPKVTGSSARAAGVFLDGLQPATTYHYRFIAESSGGGPAFGVDPDGPGPLQASEAEGEEGAFTTFPEPLAPPACPNDALRLGPAARLPDCRAYEMVSPVDKNGGDVKSLIAVGGYFSDLTQSAEDGNRLTYSSYRSFGAPKGAPYVSQYLASRDPAGGWSSEALAAPQGAAANSGLTSLGNLRNSYRAFSADLCTSWLALVAEPLLAPGAVENYQEAYRRDGCRAEAGYEALIQAKPTIGFKDFYTELQGTSADGRQAILRAPDKLTPDAKSGLWQAYYASEGELRLLCILPSGTATSENCSGGTGGEDSLYPDTGYISTVTHAISADGSRVYWTASPLEPGKPGGGTGPGKVYLRLNPGQEQSAIEGGECSEAEKACTVAVSEAKSSKASRFLAASRDGSKALFKVEEGPQAGSLYEFALGEGATQIAGKVLGVAGESEDLSAVYFVSEEALGGEAKAGRPNLYLSREGAKAYIATLSKADVDPLISSADLSTKPVFHAARASADGSHLAFLSAARLTPYDNTDVASPLPCGVAEGSREGVCDAEAYVYEADQEALRCVSCNPSGARPQGRLAAGLAVAELAQRAAASIPAAEDQLHAPRVLSGDGRRLFFDSFDALLPRDTNGAEDVYEWESAAGEEACAEKGADLYVEAAGGCLSLISSGESPQDSQFAEASPSGDDVFFTTTTSLLPQDPGLIDVYDARVEGGFAQPSATAACEGEACQGPAAPPNDPTPASAGFRGAGNVKKAAKARCAKGKARRRGRCVAKHKRARHKHQRKANRNRRNAR